ncbi:MAG: alpha/beta hydrolase [Actinomycetota bacterium]
MRPIPSTDGVDIALHDLGGDGPPLVFVHATGFHGRCYRQIADRLADVRHAYGIDLRGHGDSTVPTNGRFHWAGMADDLCAGLDALGIDGPIDFVGHSMGGATVVATELRRPGTVRTAWLFEPILFPPLGDNPSTMSEVARNRRSRFDSYDAAIERYTSRPPFSSVDSAVLEDYVRHGFRPDDGGGVILKCDPESEASTFENVDYTVFGRLGEIAAPMTIIGSTDGAPPALIAPRAAEAITTAEFVVWDGETHFGPFTDPGRAADEIRANLR